ncbi:MAG: response regulator [Candidatus Bathyanammoxibius sp.]|jgi:DNA-binding NtrC family response regulator
MKPEDYTILIVDDDEKILGSLERTFARLGYNVLVAQSGQEGLDILHKKKVELIISDVRMPIMSGVGFLEKAKETMPDAVRIIITGYADIQVAAEAINNVDVFKFVLKPWDRYHLETVVRQGLEHYDATRANKHLHKQLTEQNKELARKADTATRTTVDMGKKVAELEKKLEKVSAKLSGATPRQKK